MSKLPEQYKELSPVEFINQAHEHRFEHEWVYDYFSIQFEKYAELVAIVKELESYQKVILSRLEFLEDLHRGE